MPIQALAVACTTAMTGPNPYVLAQVELVPPKKLKLVFIWITTARISSQLASFAHKQEDLIIVDRAAVQQLCPLLDLVPELYTMKPQAQQSSPKYRLLLSSLRRRTYKAHTASSHQVLWRARLQFSEQLW